MNVNSRVLKAVFFTTQAVVKHFRETNNKGRIINISSVHEELPFPHFTSYCASKGGVKMITRNLAVELGPMGITINNVAPGAIATEIDRDLLNNPEQLKKVTNNVVNGNKDAVNPDKIGTKFAPNYKLSIPARESRTVELKLCNSDLLQNPFDQFDSIFDRRKQEADEFYHDINPHDIDEDRRSVQRQAFAGMLWSKQFYYYVVEDWLQGDPATVTPPESRKNGRNSEWKHFNDDIISMPDK